MVNKKSGMIKEARENGYIPHGKSHGFYPGFVEERRLGLLLLHCDELIQVGGELRRTGRIIARALNDGGIELAKEINAAHREEGRVVLADY